MIPVKYKRRQYIEHQALWHELLDKVAPSTDLGRGRSATSMIPNLGHNILEDYLKTFYSRKYCIFTDCATDALDIIIESLPYDTWYAPSFTWISPINALAKNKKNIRFLDVSLKTRTVCLDQYDPNYPIIVAHADGISAPRPPSESVFVVEDAAQAPFGQENNYGDVTILSFGSSKRLGLFGQGGCVLTDDESLALRLQRKTLFGLNREMELVEPGSKSFLDPLNALVAFHIFKMYEEEDYLLRNQEIVHYYNQCLDFQKPLDSERYFICSEQRDKLRQKLEAENIETRVWFKKHSSQWPFYKPWAKEILPNSDLLTEQSFDIPMNEYLSDSEVEYIGSRLKAHRNEIVA